ncbi:MAG: TonB family protein [Janthinobacterium lividum]
MSAVGTTLRAWRHAPPDACLPVRTGERPDPGHRRPHARLSPGLAAGVLVEAGLVFAVFAMTARPPAPPPVAVTIAILARPALPTPVAPPPPAALPALPPDVPPMPAPTLPQPPAAQDVLALPPDAGFDAPEAPHAEQAADSRLPATPAPPHPLAHLSPRRPARAPEPAPRPPAAIAHAAPTPPAPAPEAAPAPPAPAAILSATPAPSRAGIDSYEGRLRAAIQAALRFPPAAAMMGSDGRARVSFSIRDARPDAIRLVHGTGSPQLDSAALAAVRQAAYPPPPAAIAGREMPMLVWVEFARADAEQ